jgi:hypothetical protein
MKNSFLLHSISRELDILGLLSLVVGSVRLASALCHPFTAATGPSNGGNRIMIDG